MKALIDTNIAIYLRDGEAMTNARFMEAGTAMPISVVTLVELEGGVYRDPRYAAIRRSRLDILLTRTEVLDFTPPTARVYRDIVASLGFSRSRILDRMIAATAIVHDLTLITVNGPDFRDVPGLKLEVWPAPAAQ